MNKERVLALAELIEKQPHVGKEEETTEGFDMAQWFHPCGTPACIAGWTLALKYGDWTPALQDKRGAGGVEADAADYLGLEGTQSAQLFFVGHEAEKSLADVTPQDAAKLLRHFAETGKVDWSITNE
jgi:hypothetical protein